MLVKVNNSNFIRDTESMAIMNHDVSEKNEYYNKVRLVQNQKAEINNVKAEIDDIKTDISDIKTLLLQLLDKNNNNG